MTVVWATLGESNSERHTGGKGGAHPPVMPSTNEEVAGLPSAVLQDSSSSAPTVRNMSWGWGRQPFDPNLERPQLLSVEYDYELSQVGCILRAFEGPQMEAKRAHNYTKVLWCGWVIFLDVWNTRGLKYNFKEHGLANWGQLFPQKFLGGH